jgi:hypothetical protein
VHRSQFRQQFSERRLSTALFQDLPLIQLDWLKEQRTEACLESLILASQFRNSLPKMKAITSERFHDLSQIAITFKTVRLAVGARGLPFPFWSHEHVPLSYPKAPLYQ